MARYEYTYAVGHPLCKPPSVCVAKHRLVLYDKIGPGPHPCYWCQKSVEWQPGKRTSGNALLVDHLDNNSRNNDPSNLQPSCNACNHDRHAPNKLSESDIVAVMMQNGRKTLHRAEERTCGTCGQTFKFICADKRPNKGRFCSLRCMYDRHKTKASHPIIGRQ